MNLVLTFGWFLHRNTHLNNHYEQYIFRFSKYSLQTVQSEQLLLSIYFNVPIQKMLIFSVKYLKPFNFLNAGESLFKHGTEL